MSKRAARGCKQADAKACPTSAATRLGDVSARASAHAAPAELVDGSIEGDGLGIGSGSTRTGVGLRAEDGGVRVTKGKGRETSEQVGEAWGKVRGERECGEEGGDVGESKRGVRVWGSRRRCGGE